MKVWAVNHKNQIKGSCRILQHLAHSQPKEFIKMMKDPSVREDFLVSEKEAVNVVSCLSESYHLRM